ncbi:MAG: phosphate/phosphite/phosphonate ABC transporter substrate-binding protein [Geobacter sp.]|jgi:phosphonate transport system substrate-binding protein
MDRRIVTLLLGCLLCCLQVGTARAVATPSSPAPREYTLAVFPFLPTGNLEGIFAPIAAELSRELGKPVRFRVTPTYDAFIAALKEKKFDIVHIHPFDYVQFGQAIGYQPLVARTEGLYAEFSVKEGSPLKRLSDLRGKQIGTPPSTGSVTYLARAALQQAGIRPDEITIRNFPNHLACLQQLQIGSVDACATSAPAARVFEAQLGLKLQHIGRSQTITHALFAVHKRVPAADRERIKNSLIATKLETMDPKLRALFIDPGSATPGRYFQPVTDRDYNQARRIMQQLGY